MHPNVRIGIILAVIIFIIFLGARLVISSTPTAMLQIPASAAHAAGTPTRPPTTTSTSVRGSSGVIEQTVPDPMAIRHVSFYPAVEVLQDLPSKPATFQQEYRTDIGTRARKRKAATDVDGGFQESELFGRLAQDAHYMAPLGDGTQFQQSTMGEQQQQQQSGAVDGFD